MNRTAILEQIQKNVERLSAPDLPEYKYIPLHQKPSPSVATLHEIMRLLRTVIFPGFFGTEQEAQLGSIQYYTGVYLEKIYDLLQEQIYNGLCFEVERCCDSKDRASEISIAFINRIPHIKYLLSTDVKNDMQTGANVECIPVTIRIGYIPDKIPTPKNPTLL